MEKLTYFSLEFLLTIFIINKTTVALNTNSVLLCLVNHYILHRIRGDRKVPFKRLNLTKAILSRKSFLDMEKNTQKSLRNILLTKFFYLKDSSELRLWKSGQDCFREVRIFTYVQE